MGGGSASLELAAKTEVAAVASGEEKEVLALVSIRAPEQECSRTPLDLVAVIDVSGSMAGEKLQLVIAGLKFLVSQLLPADRFSLVLYDSEVRILFALTAATSEFVEVAKQKIAQIRAGSSTNLSGGLLKGLDILKEGGGADAKKSPSTEVPSKRAKTTKEEKMDTVARHRISSLLLFTDGIANCGITDVNALVESIQAYRAEPELKNATIHTFGFGADHQAEFLQSLSKAGDGSYWFLEKPDEIPTTLAQSLGGLLTTVAQNIQLCIFGGGEGVVRILGQFDGREDTTTTTTTSVSDKNAVVNGKLKLELGDMYAGERRDILVRLLLPKLLSTDEKAVSAAAATCLVELWYFNVSDTAPATQHISLSVERKDSVVDDATTTPDPDFALHRCRLAAAAALQFAREGSAESLEAVQRRLTTTIAFIRGWPGIAVHPLIREMLDDLSECAAKSETINSYLSLGQKVAMSAGTSHFKQRSSKPTSKGAGYTTSTSYGLSELALGSSSNI